MGEKLSAEDEEEVLAEFENLETQVPFLIIFYAIIPITAYVSAWNRRIPTYDIDQFAHFVLK